MMSAATPWGSRMTIRLHHSGSGPTLLMLHGIGQDRHVWDGLAGLADRFACIASDLPAFDTVEKMSAALATALHQAGIEKTHVIGHDLGGMVAQQLAASQPGLIDRLVLCATTPTFNDDDQALWRQRAASVPSEALACSALASADLIDLAGEIYARTLVLVGDDDTLAYREAADWLAQSIAGAKLAFVPNAAHAIPLEQPVWLDRVLRAFLG